MPETAEELYQRCRDRLVLPDLAGWDTFPFGGEIALRALAPPVAAERERDGAGGDGCPSCAKPDAECLWVDAHWRVSAPARPSGMPVVLFVEPRDHHAEPGDLPDDLAAGMGLVLARVERAVRAVGQIGRVHVCRWGDGAEHLHWWVIGRPQRLPQIVGSFCEIWDEVLPPTPEPVWRGNLERVADALRSG
jgi:diadenosine tetraphosphate (Ap4A) HIT family hydrolase